MPLSERCVCCCLSSQAAFLFSVRIWTRSWGVFRRLYVGCAATGRMDKSFRALPGSLSLVGPKKVTKERASEPRVDAAIGAMRMLLPFVAGGLLVLGSNLDADFSRRSPLRRDRVWDEPSAPTKQTSERREESRRRRESLAPVCCNGDQIQKSLGPFFGYFLWANKESDPGAARKPFSMP